MVEGGGDEDGAGDGPEEHQRLAPGEAVADADQAVDGKRAEHPGGELGLGQAALASCGEDDGEGTAGGEEEAGKAVADVGDAEVAPEAAGANGGLGGRRGGRGMRRGVGLGDHAGSDGMRRRVADGGLSGRQH